MTSLQKLSIQTLLITMILSLNTHAYAAGSDILTGTADSLIATINGTGKTYLYISEGILSLAAYIKSKNLLFLAGIVVVSIFLNIMLTVAGVG